MHVIWYTAMSMDGRLAGPGDDLSFLNSIQSRDMDEYDTFLAGIDAVLVGARTVRWLEREGHGSLPTEGKPVWVLTHDEELAARMASGPDQVLRREGDVAPVLDEIEAAGHQNVWLCGGGDVAGQALRADRVDEVILTIAPVALGGGPALFEGQGLDGRRFTLQECRRYGGDAVRARWTRER
jgi:riboflavin biosynthesis pyrimidine reductase